MAGSFEEWPFPNKPSKRSRILSFGSAQGCDEGSSILSLQGGAPLDEVGSSYSQDKACPWPKYESSSVCRSQETRIISFSSQSMSNVQSHVLPTENDLRISLASVATPTFPTFHRHPVTGSVVGSTDLRSGSKPVNSTSQLTVFYDGLVCVYDDVSFEKAQAIMLLAGNENSTNLEPESPVPTLKSSVCGGAPVFSSSISLFSPCSSGDISTPPVQVKPAKSSTALAHNHPDVCRAGGKKSAPSSGAPLTRKASLTRFLEKRKERVKFSSPSNGANKGNSECGTSEVTIASFVINSATVNHLATIN
ncbi:TIFY 6B-like protein [Drosera capensis]